MQFSFENRLLEYFLWHSLPISTLKQLALHGQGNAVAIPVCLGFYFFWMNIKIRLVKKKARVERKELIILD